MSACAVWLVTEPSTHPAHGRMGTAHAGGLVMGAVAKCATDRVQAKPPHPPSTTACTRWPRRPSATHHPTMSLIGHGCTPPRPPCLPRGRPTANAGSTQHSSAGITPLRPRGPDPTSRPREGPTPPRKSRITAPMPEWTAAHPSAQPVVEHTPSRQPVFNHKFLLPQPLSPIRQAPEKEPPLVRHAANVFNVQDL